MAYMKKVRKTEDATIIEQKLYYSWRAIPTLPKLREVRAKKIELTTEQQKKINRQRAQENLMMLLSNNFISGDLYLTLTYQGKAPSADQAKRDLDNFLQNLRKAYKRAEERLKYVAVLENLHGGGRVHGHALINAIAVMGIQKLYKMWTHGRVKVELFGGAIDDCARLAGYFKKEKIEKHAGRIRTSQGLKRPVEKKERVTRSECYNTAHIRAPKGYHIHNGLTELNKRTEDGYPYAYIIFVRDGT